MIAYEAASGEDVLVRGSRVWTPECVPSEGCQQNDCPTRSRNQCQGILEDRIPRQEDASERLDRGVLHQKTVDFWPRASPAAPDVCVVNV